MYNPVKYFESVSRGCGSEFLTFQYRCDETWHFRVYSVAQEVMAIKEIVRVIVPEVSILCSDAVLHKVDVLRLISNPSDMYLSNGDPFDELTF